MALQEASVVTLRRRQRMVRLVYRAGSRVVVPTRARRVRCRVLQQHRAVRQGCGEAARLPTHMVELVGCLVLQPSLGKERYRLSVFLGDL